MASIFMSPDGPRKRDASRSVIEQERRREVWRTGFDDRLVAAPLSSSGLTATCWKTDALRLAHVLQCSRPTLPVFSPG